MLGFYETPSHAHPAAPLAPVVKCRSFITSHFCTFVCGIFFPFRRQRDTKAACFMIRVGYVHSLQLSILFANCTCRKYCILPLLCSLSYFVCYLNEWTQKILLVFKNKRRIISEKRNNVWLPRYITCTQTRRKLELKWKQMLCFFTYIRCAFPETRLKNEAASITWKRIREQSRRSTISMQSFCW